MRIVGVLGVALAGLSVIGAVTADGQIDKRSQYVGTTAAVVDDKGNSTRAFRLVYRMLGSAKDDGFGLKGDARNLCIARNHRRISQGWTLSRWHRSCEGGV